MRRMLMALLLIVAVCPAVQAGPTAFQPGELLVILSMESTLAGPAGKVAAADPDLGGILARYGLVRWVPLLTKHRALTAREGRFLRLISEKPDFDPLAAARDLTGLPAFRAVSPNYQLQLFVLPNDPYLGSQWAVHTANDADVDLPEGWDLYPGDPGVVIAILDTGVDWSHPDLDGNAWWNPGEVPGNGVDDDGNGYVDDLYGWDCGEGDNDPRPDPYFELGIDVGFHGTHCAGIASAVADNGVGIAGAGWSCSLMGLKLTSGGSSFSTAAVTEAFLYAIEEQVDVISMSFGGTFQDFGFMQSLVDDATAAGIVCVAAAGNNNNSQMMYPAALNDVLSVGATDQNNQRASFSTYGNWVDVAAPGAQIWSCVQTNYQWDLLTQLLFMLSSGWDGVNPYMYSDGTSMACPLVAGVCGLIRSAVPAMPAAMVAQRVIATGDIVTYDQPLGVKVNAFAALQGLDVSATPATPGRERLQASPNPFNPATTLSFVLPEARHVRLRIHDPAGRLLAELLDADLPAGPHQVAWDGRDRSGRRTASGLYLARLAVDEVVHSVKLVMLK